LLTTHTHRRGSRPISVVLAFVALAAFARGQGAPESNLLTRARAEALDRVSAKSLEGHLAFLASDLLEGRGTPSRGLDIAAEYIAAQFRRAGLEPAGDDGYFQTARWRVLQPDAASLRCELQVGGTVVPLGVESISATLLGPIDVGPLPVVRLAEATPEAVERLPADSVEGRAVLLPEPKGSDGQPLAGMARMRRLAPLIQALGAKKAAAFLLLDGRNARGSGLAVPRLIDPEGGRPAPRPGGDRRPPLIAVHDPRAIAALDEAETLDGATFTVQLGPPVERPVALRNVAGILRGSDPELKDTYVIVSAHYDHIGVAGDPGDDDRIYNGANDDGSGTVAVVELAGALATLEPKPKRSILFLTFFGEEHGLLGSRYYGRHPLVPLEKTVAMVNLEQVGRTDDTEGPQLKRASMTGFDFSDVGPILARAGKAFGVEVFKHPRNSDAFFGRSDNQALADRGVPAHTVCTAFLFPDYHQAGDHWDKIDYENMALVVRAIGLGLILIADADEAPRWDESNPKAARYVQAWKSLLDGKAAAAGAGSR
jgi:hypothetical protein